MTPPLLSAYFSHLENSSPLRWRGRVTQVVGQLIESEGPFSTIGEACEIIDSKGQHWPGEIVGFTSVGTTATDSASLGTELTSSSGWTSTGWTGSYNAWVNGASNA